MATSPSLIVCLYLAYSKLLKLTAASNASDIWKTRDCSGTGSHQQSQPLHIDQCVKSKEKSTKIITVIKFPFFRHRIGNFDFQYQKIRQLITPISFQRFLTKFCTVINQLFSIISCKFCLNRLQFSLFYHQMCRVHRPRKHGVKGVLWPPTFRSGGSSNAFW